jgi:hypothetical protein
MQKALLAQNDQGMVIAGYITVRLSKKLLRGTTAYYHTHATTRWLSYLD